MESWLSWFQVNVKSEFASTRDRDLTSGNFSSQVELKHDKYFISWLLFCLNVFSPVVYLHIDGWWRWPWWVVALTAAAKTFQITVSRSSTSCSETTKYIWMMHFQTKHVLVCYYCYSNQPCWPASVWSPPECPDRCSLAPPCQTSFINWKAILCWYHLMVAWGDLSLSTEKYYSIVFVLRSVAVVYKSCRCSEMSLKAKEIEDSVLYKGV